MKKTWKHLIAVSAAAAALTAAMAFPSLAAVAKVGEQEFDDLQAAVNAAGSEPIVVDLLEDVNLTDGLVIEAGQHVTIQCAVTSPKTIYMDGMGIHSSGTLDTTSSLTFKNCHLDITANDNPGSSGGTANLIANTDLTLQNVVWTQNSAVKGTGSGMYLYQKSNLYLDAHTDMMISGYRSERASGIYADNSEYSDELPNRNIKISDYSTLKISDCDWHGMTINPIDLTVEKYSKIEITGNGNPDYGGGIGCYYGKLSILDHSSVTTDKNIGKSWGIFAKELHVDGSSTLESCDNTGNGLDVGGEGLIESGAKVILDRNGKRGLQVYSDSDRWFGDLTIQKEATVSACENGNSGILNTWKLFAESGANLKVEKNKNHGIQNVREMALNAGEILENTTATNGGGILNTGTMEIGSGVRICNNHANSYGGGLYNGSNGTAVLAEDVVLYNNHADTGADDIYNTPGQKISFAAVGTGWNLDDCNHRIDGWYDDTEGAATRWNADDDRPEKRHIVLFAPGSCETGFQIKAAHGADIYEAIDYPIDKKANGEDEIGTVKRGDKISFTLTSRLPKLLSRYVVTASDATPANTKRKSRKVRVHSASAARKVSGSDAEDPDDEEEEKFTGKYQIPDSVAEIVIFHDEMNRYLEMVDGTIRVKAGRDLREVPDGYYEVKASDSNAFRVEIDLVKLFNTGIIDYQDLMDESPIEVSYEGIVKDNAIQGDELINEAWVNDGEHDEVSGEVLDEDIPATGGMGRGMFSCLGILLMGTAVLMAERQKSHRRS